MTLEELVEDARALAKIRKPLAQVPDEVREFVGQRNAPAAPEVGLMAWECSLASVPAWLTMLAGGSPR